MTVSVFGYRSREIIKGTLRGYLSEEMQSAVRFNEIGEDIEEILVDIRAFLSETICPIPLQRLDVVHF